MICCTSTKKSIAFQVWVKQNIIICKIKGDNIVQKLTSQQKKIETWQQGYPLQNKSKL
jgi:hypothetical protein